MFRPSMPLPRDPDQTIPSFSELEAKVEANMREDIQARQKRGEDLTTDDSLVDTAFPPYPIQGSHLPSDPSHNAYGETGFKSRETVAVEDTERIRDKWNKAAFKDDPPLRLHLPLRPKSEMNVNVQNAMQPPTSPAKWTLHPQAGPAAQKYSPSVTVKPSASPSSSTTETLRAPSARVRSPPTYTRKHKAEGSSRTWEPGHKDRTRLRKIGVQFAEVLAHTAKCDECNKRNQGGMCRCGHCGWQICNQCKNERGGDQSHASFGAVHVPEGRGDLPLDGSQDRCLYEVSDWQAARTLMDMAAEATRVENSYGVEVDDRGSASFRISRGQEPQLQVDDYSGDSDMTVSMAEDEEWPNDDPDVVPEVAVDEQGLVLGYFIARRNPVRAARPSSKMTD